MVGNYRNIRINIGEFEQKFQRKFWSEETQRVIRRNLEFGMYRIDNVQNRVEYAIQNYHEVKD